MAKRQTVTSPAETFSAMRNDALLAYIEWPVFLHIRLKELNEALAISGENAPVAATSFVPGKAAKAEPEPVTNFLAQFPDGKGNVS